jgi:SAM-dependent methyltransferase
VTNADFVIADAEQLPFLDASFELVTVRIAPHHYADAARAVREMARVLVPGGRLVVIDNIAPEDPLLDEYTNRWEKARDPSHVREYTASEWRGFLAAAGLRVERMETERRPHPFADWVERMQMSAAARAALEADMLAAPAHVREYFRVIERDGRVESWLTDYLIALAIKPR